MKLTQNPFSALALCLLVQMSLTGLASCSSLPVVAPADRTIQVAAAPTRLEDARGPISATQSKVILDRLEGNAEPTAIFQRHLAVEQAVVGTPLTTGNQAQLLQDGPATYRAMFAAIEAAKDHINLETYIFDEDEVGERFAQLLIKKQGQGVQVNLIHDGVGTLRTPAAFFKRLSDSGVKLMQFNPVNPVTAGRGWEINSRDHRKLLIVDGRIAFLGGINISSVYSSGSFKSKPKPKPDGKSVAWRDTHMQLQGPVVAELQKLFIASWNSQNRGPLPEKNYFPKLESVGNQVVRAIGSTPQESYSQIYVTLLSAIGAAESSIYVTNAYFAPDPQLLTALEAAAKRGVDVKLLLPSQTDSWMVFHAGRRHYDRLLKSGVKIYERRGVILHAKTALIDGVWSTIGSTNLDWRSFLHNHELNAVVLGPDFAKQVEATFQKDLAESDAISREKWKHRPWSFRVKETFARIWEYWL